MNRCVEDMLKIVREVHAPLLLEIVKSIAALCNVDPYQLWYYLARQSMPTAKSVSVAKPSTPTLRTEPCWRCPACGKTFQDPAKLVSHILYFLRQRDRGHIEVYRELKKKVEATGKTFTEIVKEELKC